MLLRIDKGDPSHFICENQDGIQASFSIDENQISIEEINLNYYAESVALVEEYLFMKYSSLSIWNPPALLEGWREFQSLLIKDKSNSPYTMYVSQKENL